MQSKKRFLIIILILFCVSAGFSQETNTVTNKNNTNISTNTGFLAEFYDRDTVTNQTSKEVESGGGVVTTIKILGYVIIFGLICFFIIRFFLYKKSIPASAKS